MIKLNIKNECGQAKVTLNDDDIKSLYSTSHEFNVDLNEKQLIEILEEYYSIPLNILIWGLDTQIRDEFFEAIVEKITGKTWDYLKEVHKDNAYDVVGAIAKSKGYKTIE